MYIHIQYECERIFLEILSTLQNIIMNMNNVMSTCNRLDFKTLTDYSRKSPRTPGPKCRYWVSNFGTSTAAVRLEVANVASEMPPKRTGVKMDVLHPTTVTILVGVACTSPNRKADDKTM